MGVDAGTPDLTTDAAACSNPTNISRIRGLGIAFNTVGGDADLTAIAGWTGTTPTNTPSCGRRARRNGDSLVPCWSADDKFVIYHHVLYFYLSVVETDTFAG